MLQDIRQLTVPIIIAISFFIFGFMVMVNALDMSLREIVIGLIAGASCGITTLTAVLLQGRPQIVHPSVIT